MDMSFARCLIPGRQGYWLPDFGGDGGRDFHIEWSGSYREDLTSTQGIPSGSPAPGVSRAPFPGRGIKLILQAGVLGYHTAVLAPQGFFPGDLTGFPRMVWEDILIDVRGPQHCGVCFP